MIKNPLGDLLSGKSGKMSNSASLITLTETGKQKARNYEGDGREGQILTFVARSEPCTVDDISTFLGIDKATVRATVKRWTDSRPPMAIIGGQQGRR